MIENLPVASPPQGKLATLIPLIRPGENGLPALTSMGRAAACWDLWRLRWNRPANTLTRAVRLLHPTEHRLLHAREACRIQSFPDEYQWGESTYTQICGRLGNSVPPLMMRAVAAAVRVMLDDDKVYNDPFRTGFAAMTGGYGAELSAAWADHLTPRASDAPTVVSLFAGCGGSSLGYSMAGYRELLAVEWEDHAAAMFRLNFPDIPLFHGDVTDLDPASLGLAPGELDVLDGSPPCQGFSTAGSRNYTDERNDLFRQYVRLLDAWQPRTFVMENVSGLVKGKMKLKFVEMLTALKAAGPGYRVVVKLLDASRFRVPQARQRLIFIGLRNDVAGTPHHPNPLPGILTVRDAWSGLDNPGLTRPLAPRTTELAPHIPAGQNGSKTLRDAGRKGNFFNLSRLHWARPAPTICKSTTGAAVVLHPSEHRMIGLREVARLQSFPDEYQWGASTYSQAWARIGNSVPPFLMRAVATAVQNTLDKEVEP